MIVAIENAARRFREGDFQAAQRLLEDVAEQTGLPAGCGLQQDLLDEARHVRACQDLSLDDRHVLLRKHQEAREQCDILFGQRVRTLPRLETLRMCVAGIADQLTVIRTTSRTHAHRGAFIPQVYGNLIDVCCMARDYNTSLKVAIALDSYWLAPYNHPNGAARQSVMFFVAATATETTEHDEEIAEVRRRLAELPSYVDPTISFRWQPPAMLTVLAEYQHRIGNEDEADRLFNEVQRIVAEHPEVFEQDPRFKTFCRSWIARHEARKLMAEQRWEEAHQKMEEAIQGAFVAGHCYVSKGLVVERMLRLEAEILDQLRRHDQARGNREHADEIAAHAAMLKRELGPLIEDILHTIEEDIAADKRQRESGQ